MAQGASGSSQKYQGLTGVTIRKYNNGTEHVVLDYIKIDNSK